MYPLFYVVTLLQDMRKVQIICIRQNKLGLLNHENYEYFTQLKSIIRNLSLSKTLVVYGDG